MKAEKKKRAPKAMKIADTMKQAAAVTGIPLRVLQDAKAAGCPAFRGSRIYLEDLRAWLAVPENMDKVSKSAGPVEELEAEILRERLRLLRVKAEQAEGRVILVAEARREFGRAAATTKSKLMAVPSSVAPLVVGKDIHEIEERLKTAIRDACEAIQKHDWNKP